MIDRTQLVLPLRPKPLLVAAGTSASLFAALLIGWLACMLAAVLAYCGCWLAYFLVLVLAYAIVIALGLGVIAGAIGLFAKAGESTDKDTSNGAGCGGCVLVLVGLAILGSGIPWVCSMLDGPRAVLSQAASDSYDSCSDAADVLLFDLFLPYRVYLWSWSVLAFSLSLATLTLLSLATLSSERLLRRAFLRSRFKCPKCGEETPVFICPGCGERHADLAPSAYGLIKADCGRCGRRLPTLDLAGRLRLAKACGSPTCFHDLKGDAFGAAGEFHYAVVGAQSSGKSNYMIAGVQALLDDFAPSNGYHAELPDPIQEHEYLAYVNGFRQGKPVPKTSPTAQRSLAFTVALKRDDGLARLLYLYDAAGETFEGGDLSPTGHSMTGQDYHRFVDGILLMVDPFAEETFRQQQAGQARDHPARKDAAYLLGRVLPFLERSLKVGPDRPIPVPVAVVVTKSDACGLDQQLTGPDLRGRLGSMAAASEDAAQDAGLVRQFLVDAGAGEAVRILESRFSHVSYFAVSALGRSATLGNRAPFQPRRALGPILWLGQQTHALTDRHAAAQALVHLGEYLSRCLRGREGGAVRIASWSVVIAGLCLTLYGAWQLLGVTGSLVTFAALLILPLLLVRYLKRGTADVHAVLKGMADFREWFTPALKGRIGPTERRWAWGVLVGGLAVIGGLFYVSWPIGLVVILLLGGLFALSKLGR
jgi:hypothetical protein